MWVIQCDLDGDLVEKRKIASADDSERMDQIQWISDDRFFFVGVNDQNDDCLFGVFFYDGANIEIEYIRQIPTAGGYVRNPEFAIDEYNDVILIWDVYNGATSKFEKIQVNKFALANANSNWEWSKTLTISGNIDGINHAGVNVDVFGNYSIVTDVQESENQRYAVIHYIKYDGNVIKETKIDDIDSVGIHAKKHTVDNSGDCILVVDRRQPDQMASYRFNNDADIDEDTTKQNLVTPTFQSPGNVSIDTAVKRFGNGSLKLSAPTAVKFPGYALQSKEWSFQAWMSIASAHHATNTKPLLFDVTPIGGDSIQVELDGDSTSGNYEKVVLYINSVEVATSATAVNWTLFGSQAWVHVTFQKREESLGLYQYEVFLNGTLVVNYQSTSDISVQDVSIGKYSGPVTGNSLVGWVDDLVIDNVAPYNGTYTVPTAEIPITTSISDSALIKFDRLHDKRDAYTLSGLSKYTNITFSDIELSTTWTTLSVAALTNWTVGAGGLQILDMSQTISTLNPATYAFTTNKTEYATKTSTIPSPLGKKLNISADVISKFYMRDALYQKIDNVKEFTFTQDVKLTKHSILQQFNENDVVTAFGTIVDVPNADSLSNPGLGTKYKVCLLYTSPSPRD